MTQDAAAPKTLSSQTRLLFVAILALAFILFGVAVSGLEATLAGLDNILFVRDTLITDYVELGGVGAAFFNAGMLTIIAAGFYWATGAHVGGGAIAALLLVLGFALFGKNLLNVWPILAGVFLYSRFRGEPFGNHLNVAFFGCALAPVVSEVLFTTALAPTISIPLGLATGCVMGFIMPPVAAQLFKAHSGYSLYNMGFTAGLIGTLIVAIYISYGFVPEPVFIWAVDQTDVLAPFLMVCFVVMIVVGRIVDRECLGRYLDLLSRPGQSPSDYAADCGDGAVLINMGVLGILSTGYVLVIGGDLNGPVIGAILSIVGFGGFGKHAVNCVPVVAGVFLATVLKQGDLTAPGLILATLFSTTLAPISGSFGWYWGIIAGIVHVSAAQTVGVLHGGLNLYNNGFAAGFVAAALAPVALAFQARFQQKSGQKI